MDSMPSTGRGSSAASTPTMTCTRQRGSMQAVTYLSLRRSPRLGPATARCWPGSRRSVRCCASVSRRPAPTAPVSLVTWHAPTYRSSRSQGPTGQYAAEPGKDDTLDAIAAARAALTGQRVQVAKERSGAVEALRVLRTTRKTAVRCRRATLQQLHSTIVAGHDELRDQLRHLTRMRRLRIWRLLATRHSRLPRRCGRDQDRSAQSRAAHTPTPTPTPGGTRR